MSFLLINKETAQTNTAILAETAIGVKDFRSLIENSTVFVDKSLLIKEFLNDKGETLLITYPRRWGKTLNMSMIKTFLELEVDEQGNILPEDQKQNTNIFAQGKLIDGKKSSLNIWHDKVLVKQHFGKHPVVYITLKNARGKSYKDIEQKVIQQVSSLYKNHTYLLNSDFLSPYDKKQFQQYIERTINVTDLENSLNFLSELLNKHFKQKVFILIDEYDTPINHANLAFEPEQEIKDTVGLFRGLLGGALKENPYLEKGLVTGILRIAKADLFSGVNNLQEYNILSEEYSRYYGFTKEEVEELFISYNVPESMTVDIKNWYNGYNFRGAEVYNPWSILKCLSAYQYRIANSKKPLEEIKQEILQSYWEESGNLSFMLKLLKNELIKTYVERLIDTQPITIDLQRQLTMDNFIELRNLTTLGSNYRITSAGINLLFSYLFFGGYLTIYELPALFVLPNREIQKEMANRLLQYYQAEYTVDAMLFQAVTDKVQIILDTKLKDRYLEDYIGDFRLALQELLKALPDFLNLADTRLVAEKTAKTVYHGNEDLIHSVMNYIVLQVKTISRFATEISVGLGKADIAFIDAKNRCAAIIELKYNQSTDIALEQIADRSYARDIVNSCNTILLGVNVLPDKTVQAKHKIITNFP